MNVSAIVVRTALEHVEKAVSAINEVDCCEVHFYDCEGKLIITIEGESIHDQIETMKLLQDLPFVLSSNLMYSYCEDELRKAVEEIEGKRITHKELFQGM